MFSSTCSTYKTGSLYDYIYRAQIQTGVEFYFYCKYMMCALGILVRKVICCAENVNRGCTSTNSSPAPINSEQTHKITL